MIRRRHLLLTFLALLPWSLNAQAFSLDTQLIREGAPDGSRWTIPRMAAIPTEGKDSGADLLMTLAKLSTTGTDVYRGIGFCTSHDGGKTWSALTELPYQAKPLRDDIRGMFGAVVPVFHRQTGKILLLGNCVGYTNYGNSKVKLTGMRFPAYAVYDPVTKKWSADYAVLMDQEEANTTSGIPWIQEDGSLLWPCNGGQVLRATFDGTKLSVIGRSPRIEGLGKAPKNTGEYHLTKSGDKFFLTLRCPDQNRIAVSQDGQNFQPAIPLTWDDGTIVPSVATQMRWVRQQGRLYLVYTRADDSSKGIFRSRAPLWMAEMDTTTLKLKKKTEVIAVPISPARDDLGNFGTAFVNDGLSYVTTSEFGRTKGSNSRVYITRIEATGQSLPSSTPDKTTAVDMTPAPSAEPVYPLDLHGQTPEDFDWKAHFAKGDGTSSDQLQQMLVASRIFRKRMDELSGQYRKLMTDRGNDEGVKLYNVMQEHWENLAQAELAFVGASWSEGSGKKEALAKHRFKIYLRRLKEMKELKSDSLFLNE
ncbi:DUF1311 domain-containing protein [Prosthecobacter fusiformis]|nr:DUF1311 domain-containing protein [Prosthecobacter fusiformis]